LQDVDYDILHVDRISLRFLLKNYWSSMCREMNRHSHLICGWVVLSTLRNGVCI